jgi:hypothetical protein
MNMDEYYKHKEKFSPEVCARIKEMRRNGIRSSDEQSKILKRDYGIDIQSHFIAEYRYRQMNGYD